MSQMCPGKRNPSRKTDVFWPGVWIDCGMIRNPSGVPTACLLSPEHDRATACKGT